MECLRSPDIILDFEDNSSSSRSNPLIPGLKLLSASILIQPPQFGITIRKIQLRAIPRKAC